MPGNRVNPVIAKPGYRLVMDLIFKNDVARIRQHYKTLQQQQMTFVSGLENSRTDQYERSKPLRSIKEVKTLYDRSKNTRDKRAMKQWLDLLNDLGNLQRKLESNGPLEGSIRTASERWKALLNTSHDFSGLKAKYPHQELNHLSCEGARVLYGGCVSLVPVIFDQIQKIQNEMMQQSDSSQLKETWPPASRRAASAVHSAGHHRSKTETQVPQRAKTAIGQRDQAVDTKDLSKRMLKLSFGKLPKGKSTDPVLFYRRTLNGRADTLHVNGEITLDKAPWRGASYDRINHVDHRRYVNLEGKYY